MNKENFELLYIEDTLNLLKTFRYQVNHLLFLLKVDPDEHTEFIVDINKLNYKLKTLVEDKEVEYDD